MYRYEQRAEELFDVRSKSGPEWMAMCSNPDHDNTRTPAMSVNVEKGVFYCYACDHKGSYVAQSSEDDFEMQANLIQSLVASAMAAEETDHQVQRYNKSYLNRFAVPTDYWEGRGLTEATVKQFDLGYDYVQDAATIPCYDLQGHLYGVTRRYANPEPGSSKYRMPKGWKKAEHLYGANLARGVDSTSVVLVEGQIDAMKAWQAGFVGLSQNGSGISTHQIHILLQLGVEEVILCLDNPHRDKAGAMAQRRAKGWYERGGKLEYYKDRDLSRNMAVYAVNWTPEHPKDLGEMDDSDVKELLGDKRLYLQQGEN